MIDSSPEHAVTGVSYRRVRDYVARRNHKSTSTQAALLRRAAAYLSQSNLPGKGFTRS